MLSSTGGHSVLMTMRVAPPGDNEVNTNPHGAESFPDEPDYEKQQEQRRILRQRQRILRLFIIVSGALSALLAIAIIYLFIRYRLLQKSEYTLCRAFSTATETEGECIFDSFPLL